MDSQLKYMVPHKLPGSMDLDSSAFRTGSAGTSADDSRSLGKDSNALHLRPDPLLPVCCYSRIASPAREPRVRPPVARGLAVASPFLHLQARLAPPLSCSLLYSTKALAEAHPHCISDLGCRM